MEGVAGSPEVASIMFEKINEPSIFLGDATLVGTIQGLNLKPTDPPKRTTNPNVAIEMGLAAGLLGWERIICVMNEHYGTRADLPFDVRNRRFPIDFTLSPEDYDDQTKRNNVGEELKKWIKKSIVKVEAHDLRKVDAAIKRLDLCCLNLMSIHSQNNYFSVPDLNVMPFTDQEKFNSAAIRLLELDLLRAEIDGNGTYAHHWTYLGKKVLKRITNKTKP